MRVAFQLYEHEDMLGLAIDEHILLRTLKVSPCSFSLHEQLIYSWKYMCVCISRLLKLHNFLSQNLIYNNTSALEISADKLFPSRIGTDLVIINILAQRSAKHKAAYYQHY